MRFLVTKPHIFIDLSWPADTKFFPFLSKWTDLISPEDVI